MENIRVLKVNSVKCLMCNTELFSRYRHDFTTCHCENKTSTDGGLDYQRVSGENLDLVEITSEYEEITKEGLEERTKVLKEKADKEFQNNLLKLLIEIENK